MQNDLQETVAGTFRSHTDVFPFVTKAMRKVTGNSQQLLVFGNPSGNVDYTWTAIGVLMIMLP